MRKLASIDEMFGAAIEFRDSSRFTEAMEELQLIIQTYPNHPKLGRVYTVLAGIYKNFDDCENSEKCFRKATELDPNSELASLGLYVSLVKKSDYERAIMEISRYLDQNAAKLYMDTLEELLDDIDDGYATNYKEIILTLAKKNKLI